MKTPWTRLIRFIATDGRTLYGEPILPASQSDFDIGDTTEQTGLRARVIAVGADGLFGGGAEQNGPVVDGNATTTTTKVTEEIVTVKQLLGPLAQSDVPVIRCIGLNYSSHIKETGRKPPKYPFLFYKTSPAVADHGANVVIPKIAQDDQADYEGELCVVIGRDAKDVPMERALEFVAGYTVGNDISSRKLQRDQTLAGPVPQWSFSKGFDTYAPLGPVVVSSALIQDPSKLHLTTIVNGELRQESGIDDLCFDIPYLIWYFSQGTTLERGSVIMTGTPGGVGSGLKPTPKYLAPGTKMEVKISEIGTLRNGVEFA